MDSYEEFKLSLKKAAERFRKIDKKETIRLISHLDADGISACSIMIKTLNLDNRKYSISIVPQLKKNIVEELAREPYKNYIFSDLGAGQLSAIKELLHGRNVFIFDHHQPEDAEVTENITHVNPHNHGIDGSREISGSGVVYLFAREYNKKLEDLAHIAIIGAIGDVQEQKGFEKLNSEILDKAIEHAKIKVKKGLRLFGAQTKPLHKVLEYCTDPYIPGVTGSESGSIQFLQQLGISPRNSKGWIKIVHLDEEELQKLITGIVMRRLDEDNPEDVLGNVYILQDEEKESPTRDAKEFSTLLNACGRMGKASLGIGACLGDKKIKQKAITGLNGYKREIINAINWYHDSRNKEYVHNGEGYVIINAKDAIMPTIIGTLASIISKSKEVRENTFIMGIADMLDGSCKVSLRISGFGKKDIDLREVVQLICGGIEGCEAGGHKNAAGAMIPYEKEAEFIEKSKEVLSRLFIEEMVH